MRPLTSFISKYREQLLWLAGLLALFFMPADKNSFSLCFFKLIGFSWCPGCGIGHAIHHLLHLHFRESFEAHRLGIPALLVIIYNVFKPFSHLIPKTP